MKRVGLAVIGCGYIAQTAHIPNILKIPEARLTAVVDLDQRKMDEIHEKFGIENCYTDYRTVLTESNTDAVIICTPTSTHTQIAVQAAEAGKHVFCEKPMSTTSEGADNMIRAAERNKVKLMVGHFLRFLPNHIKAKEMVKDRKIGEIFYAEAYSEIPGPYDLPRSHFFFKKEQGGGVLLDYGTHLIDILCWLFDDSKVDRVAAFTHTFMENIEVENAAILNLQFTNGVLGRVSVFWVPWKSWEVVERYVRVLGSKGKIVSELTGPSLSLYKEGSLMSRLKGMQKIIPRPLHPKLPGSDYAYKRELEHFVRCIIKDEEPAITGYQGKIVTKVIEAALRSYHNGEFVKVDY